ncbi:MAG: hypothetical protein H2184_15855 [Candidatus Galacturonibacter soehngenii]|nr:hypothetical protein [Candidatus Galacturonibacter soehngenii]
MKYDEKKIERIEEFFIRFDLIKEILGLLFTYIFGGFVVYMIIFINCDIATKLLGITVYVVIAVIETVMFISRYFRRKSK